MNATPQQNENAILFPVGRLVSGDLYEPQKTDMQGNPLMIKTGNNAGKERVNYFFALAIAKTPGVGHWGSEPGWGQKIWALGHSFWPQGQAQNPRFAWKIDDGDSAVPNEAGRKNCDKEGYPGHWILKFGSMFATKVTDEQGNPMPTPGLVKRGFYIEVWGSVESNGNIQKPGIYLNHTGVAYRAPGKEISAGQDLRTVGFGKSPLPAGVTAGPPPSASPPPPAGAAPVPPGAATAPPVGTTPPPPAGVPSASAPPAPTAVAPNASFITPPAPGAQPAAAAAPPPPAAAPAPAAAPPPPAAALDLMGAPAGYRMANAAGPRYDAYRNQGWTDAQLLQQGHMVKL
jgi:hypothetical protein